MKNWILVVSLAFVLGCATPPYQDHVVSEKSRWPSSISAQMPSVQLADVTSANSGYWSVKRNSKDFFGRYKAYIVAQPEHDYYDLYVFAETDALESLPQYKDQSVSKDKKAPKLENESQFQLIAKNQDFVWGSLFAGTEPTLTTNKKGSLVIQSMNEGIGRSAWSEQVIARFNPVTAKIEVIGYEYNSFDKIEGSGLTCSFNFSTGNGNVTITPRQWTDDGSQINPPPKSKAKSVQLSRETIDLSNWKSSDRNAKLTSCSNDL